MTTSTLIKNTGISLDKSTGSFRIDELGKLAGLLLNSCGNGPLLHIGPADLSLLQTFLIRGVQVANVDLNISRVESCEQRLSGRFKFWDGESLPFADNEFSTVLVTGVPANQAISAAFAKEVLRVSSANVFLYLSPEECSQAAAFRKKCEVEFFEVGARKHPAYYRVNDYQALQREQGKIPVVLEKLPAQAALEYSLSALAEERDLHMDMTREPGSRSDAHIIRYMLASRFVRPNDRILDAACGLGYGAYTLLKCSDAASVLGIDGSEYAVKYATINFVPGSPGLNFKEGWLPDAIKAIPDNSIDLITSFETLEHVEDPKGLLAEFKRVLTPSGRIVLSVPNDWSDETGEDPNPFHFHVYTWAKILEQTRDQFLVEAAYAQTADQFKRNKQWVVGTRQLFRTSLDTLADNGPECEWCLLVGMKTPLVGSSVPYQETTYDLYPENQNWHVTRFDDYQNPWLVKGLVTIGHRIDNPELLQSISTQVALEAPPSSPDEGAALCVLGYRLYEKDTLSSEQVGSFDAQCQAYLSSNQTSPQQLRWQVSLCYLLAQIWMRWGRSDKAIAYYKSCIAFDCAKYSPTLVTKQINAYLNLGVIESGLQNPEAAKVYWKQGVLAAERALKLDWKAAYGSLENPTDFGLHELGAVIESAASCAYALKYCNNSENRTPQWWHQLHRDRVSQLQQIEVMRQEISRLNELMIDKDIVIKDITEASQRETNSLYAKTIEKDVVLNQTGIEIERLHRLIESKDRLLGELGLEISRLNLVINEKDLMFDAVNRQLMALQDSSVSHDCHLELKGSLNNTLAELSQAKHSLLQSLELEQARYNQLRQTRLIRWRDAVAARPLTVRGLAKIAYLTTSLLTPKPLRQGLRGVIIPFVNHLRKTPSAPTRPTEPESGYFVKLPNNPEKERPVIVHVIANFMTGGSSRLVVDIFEYLGCRYDQRVVTSYAPTPAAYIGIPISEIRFPDDESPFIDVFEEVRPDFIHMHYWGDCDEPWYAKSVKAAEVLGIPVVENINTPIKPYYSDVIQRYVYVSNYVRRVFGELESEKHVTIYPGSDFSHFEPKSERKPSENCIGMVYRLENDKLNSESIMPFILAVKKNPAIKALIVGGGSLMEEFMEATEEAGVAHNFEFTGYVPYSSLPSFYERMNIFVAPVWKESFGQVSPFAMNMRVPVVGFDTGAIGEIVDDPSLLAPSGNSEALADIIVSLLNDAPRRQKIAEQQRKRAHDHYSVQAMIEGYRVIYHSIMVDNKK